jgi:23S rRNA-/tRNA-specific pseudouridylate synthase
VELLSERLEGKVWVVHRLDRETSGVMVFARDAETHRTLNMAFERREPKKRYLAAVSGTVAGDGEVALPLKEFGSGRVAADPKGKPALTRYRVLRTGGKASLLEVEPETGRRHQIRAHLYAVGHPVLGDTRYGVERPVGGAARLMLHARELTLPFPDGPARTFRAEPPEVFTEILKAFGLDRPGPADGVV